MNRMSTENLIGETKLSEAIIGAAFTVSNALGCGFVEKGYENALAIELRQAGLKVKQQVPIAGPHRAQCLNYLRASGLTLGLVINFGVPRLDVQRVQHFAA
jgi:hypothetical protein